MRSRPNILHVGLLLSVLASLPRVQGFVSVYPSLIQTKNSASPNSERSLTVTWLAKRGQGNLGSLIEDGESTSKTRTVPKKRSKRKQSKGSTASSATKKSKESESSATISPSLQEWISKTDGKDTDVAEAADRDDQSRNKASKNSLKSSEKEEQNEVVVSLVQQLEAVLETAAENKKAADIQQILDPIRQLLNQPQANGNLRQLLAGNKRLDYRLAWVGSDDAICHLGTGLHNVPLARLQEVFFSCIGKSRLEVYEVIRIIGPFPNVRNTLEGSGKVGKRNVVYDPNEDKTVTELKLEYDSMTDGTGKQITAGVIDNVRKVDLHIAFCDENAIVAVVPPEGDNGLTRTDPLEDSGTHVLFFVKEVALDEKLDALRVL